MQLDDGRVIEGDFQCMDKELNFVVGGATEYHGMTNRKFLQVRGSGNTVSFFFLTTASLSVNAGCETTDVMPPSRYLGLAIVPGSHTVKVCVLKPLITC